MADNGCKVRGKILPSALGNASRHLWKEGLFVSMNLLSYIPLTVSAAHVQSSEKTKMSHSARGWYFLSWQYTYLYERCTNPSRRHQCKNSPDDCALTRRENTISNRWYGRSPAGEKLTDDGKRDWYDTVAYPKVAALMASEIATRNRRNVERINRDPQSRRCRDLPFSFNRFRNVQLSKMTEEPGEAKRIS